MVCKRCVMVVKQLLDSHSILYTGIELGEVKLEQTLSTEKLTALNDYLKSLGFELVDDKKSSIANQIKSVVIRYIHFEDTADSNKKLSVILSEKFGLDYNYLSSIFSTIEGTTIEKYVILQRIERAKELIDYNELSLNEIADALGYSSVQHLSQQFKKITGLTPSQYKSSKEIDRKPLDQVGS